MAILDALKCSLSIKKIKFGSLLPTTGQTDLYLVF